jgi:hypothetical protein
MIFSRRQFGESTFLGIVAVRDMTRSGLSLRWAVVAAIVLLGGFTLKDFVITWRPWGIRRERDHHSIIFRGGRNDVSNSALRRLDGVNGLMGSYRGLMGSYRESRRDLFKTPIW